MSVQDLRDYLDGTEISVVAAAARRLDREAFLAGQISKAHYDENVTKSDKQLFIERNNYRDKGHK